ncbi:hypothetical protein ROZALSC1DRAFT_22800, partial [Rozella allomycis CSF55]
NETRRLKLNEQISKIEQSEPRETNINASESSNINLRNTNTNMKMNGNSSMDADDNLNNGNVNVGYDKLRQPTAIHLNGKKIDPITTPRTTLVESMEALEHQLSYTTLGSTSNTRRRRFHGALNAKKAINTKMKNMCSPYHKEFYVKSINRQNHKRGEKSVRFSGNAEHDEGICVKNLNFYNLFFIFYYSLKIKKLVIQTLRHLDTWTVGQIVAMDTCSCIAILLKFNVFPNPST